MLVRSHRPEQKRRIIGDTFMRVADVAIKDLNLKPEDVFLAQGTLRSVASPRLQPSPPHLCGPKLIPLSRGSLIHVRLCLVAGVEFCVVRLL
jgi:hypothetical protein